MLRRLKTPIGAILTGAFLLLNGSSMAQSKQGSQRVTIPFGAHNRIVYQLDSGTYSVFFGEKETVRNAYALCKGKTTLDSRMGIRRNYSARPVDNNLGRGMVYTITSVGETRLQQLFTVFPGKDYFVMELRVSGKDAACNYMSPLTADKLMGTEKGDNRALFVPFDNDMWVRYNAAVMDTTDFTSSEVTALYDNGNNSGIVIGSLEHNVWKSGIALHGAGDGALHRFAVFAGFTDSVVTHDNLPHGTVQPVNGVCASPMIMMGRFNDWRLGMETYASLNRLAEPRMIFHWSKPTPVGWNSWGVIQSKLSLEKAKAVVDFFHDSCKTFRTADHTLFIDLDAYWDKLVKGGIGGDVSQLREFVRYCEQKGFQPGIYWAPFADWGKKDTTIEGSNFSYGQAWTRQNGHTMDVDGGRAMDPTYPGTKDRIVHYIRRFKELGFQMIKIDFLGHADLEADRFYDATVTTGMQAFRKGMEFVDSVLGDKMLVYAAISPNLATSRYVHMRRIGCDAFSSIANTEYTLNSSGYGWWQSKLYDYIDADHVVFADAPENSNRARLTSSVITGSLMTGDDYSLPGHWRSAAVKLLQNQEILSLAYQGKRFRPLEANTGKKGVAVFGKQEGGNVYLALINYDAKQKVFEIPLERLPGAQPARSGWKARELFEGNTLQGTGNLKIAVDGGSSVIYTVSTVSKL